VKVGLKFLYVPSTIHLSAFDSVETASQVFLKRELNADPATMVWNVQTTVLSQNGEYLSSSTIQTDTAELPSRYSLSMSLEAAVQYRLQKANSDVKDMETRILDLFSSRWVVLLDLLRWMDEAYFAQVEAIQIRTVDPKESTVFDQFDSPNEMTGEKSPPKMNTEWDNCAIIAVLAVAGVGVLMSCLTVLVLLLTECCRRQAQDHCTNDDMNSIDNKPTYCCEKWIVCINHFLEKFGICLRRGGPGGRDLASQRLRYSIVLCWSRKYPTRCETTK
jgi:hypothetical protein